VQDLLNVPYHDEVLDLWKLNHKDARYYQTNRGSWCQLPSELSLT